MFGFGCGFGFGEALWLVRDDEVGTMRGWKGGWECEGGVEDEERE